MKNNILILGDGLLGSEIRKQTNWDYISRKKDNFDLNNFWSYSEYIKSYDQIINCIAETDTYSQDREKHWKTNYLAVIDLVNWCDIWIKKLIHISTDYIYSQSVSNASENDVPVHARNWYSYTKLLGDAYVQTINNYLLIRTSFKPKPFLYPNVVNQFGNFDYVDKIAELIIKLIENNAYGVYNVGTETKSMGELASQTIDILSNSKIIHPSMPMDITMNINKMKEFLK